MPKPRENPHSGIIELPLDDDLPFGEEYGPITSSFFGDEIPVEEFELAPSVGERRRRRVERKRRRIRGRVAVAGVATVAATAAALLVLDPSGGGVTTVLRPFESDPEPTAQQEVPPEGLVGAPSVSPTSAGTSVSPSATPRGTPRRSASAAGRSRGTASGAATASKSSSSSGSSNSSSSSSAGSGQTSAPASGAPGASDTGVPSGTKLTVHRGDLEITKDGTHIDGLDVYGYVMVKADNVRITNTRVRGVEGQTGKGLIHAVYGNKGLVVVDSTLIPDYPSVYSYGVKGAGFTLRRVEAAKNVDSVQVFGDNVRIEDSWLHNHIHYASDPAQGGGASHNDGVQVLGGSNITLSGNTIADADNAAVQVTQDNSAVSGLIIRDSYLSDGTCSVKLTHKGQSVNLGPVSLSGNRFGRGQSIGGCAVVRTSKTTLNSSGNVWADTDKSISVKVAD